MFWWWLGAGVVCTKHFWGKKLEMWSLERGSGNKWGDFSFLRLFCVPIFLKEEKRETPVSSRSVFAFLPIVRWTQLLCVSFFPHHPQMFSPAVNLFTTPAEAVRSFSNRVSKKEGCYSLAFVFWMSLWKRWKWVGHRNSPHTEWKEGDRRVQERKNKVEVLVCIFSL